MILSTALDQFGYLISKFTATLFSQIVAFFNPSSSGILKFWPFFFAAMFFIILTLVKGIVSLFNDL